MESDDDFKLKILLGLWRCDVLYNLFKEEEIDLEDLKLIKHHHIKQLLQTYKMGIRIRFEHYLEKWRNNIGIPLSIKECTNQLNEQHSCSCCQHKVSNNTNHFENHQFSNDVNVAKLEIHADNEKESISNTPPVQRSPSPSPSPSPKEPEVISVPALTPILYAKLQPSETSFPESGGGPILTPVQKLPTLPTRPKVQQIKIVPTSTLMINEKPRLRESVYSLNSQNIGSFRTQCPYNLAQILIRSGTKGQYFNKYYEKYHRFTVKERSYLLQLISAFYRENDYHMSLQRSHELEAEILEMFPNEKLQMYRTGKRGKLYIKYTNMKCYKQAIFNKQRAKDIILCRSQDVDLLENVNEDQSMDADTSDMGQEINEDISIKLERME